DMRVALDGLRQRHSESRFTDPRLPGKQHNPSIAGPRVLPTLQQQLKIFVAPDQWSRLRAQRLEAAQNDAFADYPPSALPLRKAGERLRAEVLDLEQGADLLARTLGDNECIRLGERLKPGGEVRRLAND